MEIVTARYGKFIINPKDFYIGHALKTYGEYDQSVIDFLLQLINNETIVVDIGANIGAMTLPFASKAKKVYVMEPHPTLYNMLCGNIALNDLKNVIAYNVGISNKAGYMSYQDLPENNNGSHSLIAENHNGSNRIIVSDQVPACHLLKIDVEGHELNVLQGATNMIQIARPTIFIENDRRDKAKALVEYLITTLKYDCYWVCFQLFNENNYNQLKDNIYGNTGTINMICVPTGAFDFTTIGLEQVQIDNPIHQGTIQ